MKNDLMTVGQLAKKMNVTVRTLQYYDKENLLKPSEISEGGRRLYSQEDVLRLSQIISLKALGFSLEDIKGMLLTLSTPSQFAGLLLKQGSLVKNRIKELNNALFLIESLHEEVLRLDSVDFKKYADIISLLNLNNTFHWAFMLLDDDLMEHSKSRFIQNPELALDVLSTYQSILEEAILLKRNNEPVQSKKSLSLAKKWWDMVEDFTGGDMSLLPSLMSFNGDKSSWDNDTGAKQAEVDEYLGKILEQYFLQNNISIPTMEG